MNASPLSDPSLSRRPHLAWTASVGRSLALLGLIFGLVCLVGSRPAVAGLPSVRTAAGLPWPASDGPGRPLGMNQTTYNVSIFDDRFDPAQITIPTGGTVVWTNRGSTTHSVTHDDHHWSLVLPPGSSGDMHFISAGTYPYHCAYHPEKRGTVIVGGAEPIPSVSPTTEAPPAISGSIVYNAVTSGTFTDLYTIEPDGSQKQQLTNTPNLTEAQPRWSPDRLRVAFAAGAGQAPLYAWRVYVMDLSSRQARAVTSGPENYEPAWSPDGAWIAYTEVLRQGGTVVGTAISKVRPDGSGQQRLALATGSAAGVGSPDWSPDGTRIVFVYRSDARGGEFYTVDAAGTQVQRLLERPGWDDIDPQWSPDGRYLAFVSGPAGGPLQSIKHDLWLVDLTTGIGGTIARAEGWNLRRPAWSPFGSEIVFNGQYGNQPYGLYLVPAHGGAVTGPLDAGYEPDWASASLIPITTPGPAPTGTLTPPPVPTFPLPGPGPSATLEPPPTFPPPTEVTPGLPTEEPTETPTQTATSRASPTPEPTATYVIDGHGQLYLPWLANMYTVGEATATPEPAACLSREIEPNNTTDEADLQPQLCEDRTIRGALPPGDSQDIFRIEIQSAGRLAADLLLVGLPAGSDYDLLLYRAGALDPIAVSRNAGIEPEHVEADVVRGRYYLRVVPASGSTQSQEEYRLTAYRQ